MTELRPESGGELDYHQARLEALEIEMAAAWFDYKEATAGLSEEKYIEVEPWAYSLLAQKLKKLRGWQEALGGASRAPEN